MQDNKIFNSALIKNFFVYAFGEITLKLIYFVTAPILMRVLTKAEYGVLALVINFIEIVLTIVGLGFRQLIMVEYFHHDAIGCKKLVNDLISIYAIITFPIILFSVLGRDFINKFIFVGTANAQIIIFCLIVVFLKFFSEIFYQILQYSGKSIRLVSIQICAALVVFFLNIAFIYFLNWGILSNIAAQLVGIIFAIIFAFIFYFRNLYQDHFDLQRSLSKTWWYIKMGFPFIPRVLMGWVLAVGDRWVLAKYASLQDVGLYSVADMFGKMFQVVFIMPFTYAYVPYMINKYAKNKDKALELDKKNLTYMVYVLLTLIIAVFVLVKPLIYIFKPLICKIITPQYFEAMQYVPLLLVGYIFLFGSYFASVYLHYKKQVYSTLFAVFIPAIFNLFLNILLVPKYGISGSVFATLVSYMLYFLITLACNFWSKKIKT